MAECILLASSVRSFVRIASNHPACTMCKSCSQAKTKDSLLPTCPRQAPAMSTRKEHPSRGVDICASAAGRFSSLVTWVTDESDCIRAFLALRLVLHGVTHLSAHGIGTDPLRVPACCSAHTTAASQHGHSQYCETCLKTSQDSNRHFQTVASERTTDCTELQAFLACSLAIGSGVTEYHISCFEA